MYNNQFLIFTESNAARATGQGGVAVLLNMFDDWHHLDIRNKHVTLRKSILICLKHITSLRKSDKIHHEVYSNLTETYH